MHQENSINIFSQKGKHMILVGQVHITIMLWLKDLLWKWHTGINKWWSTWWYMVHIRKPNRNGCSCLNMMYVSTIGYNKESHYTHLYICVTGNGQNMMSYHVYACGYVHTMCSSQKYKMVRRYQSGKTDPTWDNSFDSQNSIRHRLNLFEI